MNGFKTVVIDPPWAYDRDGGLGSNRAAADQYQTMTNAAIAALPVRDMAERNSHIYLWTTNPRLFKEGDDGLGPREMLDVWGFRYVTMLTWHKLGSPGMGWYFRGDTEHVLFGVRGKAPIPAELRVSNIFAAPRTVHSAKPDRFYEIVERVSPGPWLEVFARRRRVGWGAWGHEAPDEGAALTQQHMDLVA